jgi:hypothetical protein
MPKVGPSRVQEFYRRPVMYALGPSRNDFADSSFRSDCTRNDNPPCDGARNKPFYSRVAKSASASQLNNLATRSGFQRGREPVVRRAKCSVRVSRCDQRRSNAPEATARQRDTAADGAQATDGIQADGEQRRAIEGYAIPAARRIPKPFCIERTPLRPPGAASNSLRPWHRSGLP